MITEFYKNKMHKISRKCMLRFCHFQLVNNAKSADWAFTSIGSKTCNGPTGFVAIPKLNTTQFLDKVEKYTNYQNSIQIGYFNVTPKV
jgi:hypothetical protein